MQRPAPTSGPRSPRVLFVPVSGPGGSGELMRCLTVARELRRASPDTDIHFLVARNGVFREAVDFPIHDCDASPTRSTPQVLATLRELRPDVVVFDNAGRTEQLRAAKALGARLVFTSRSPRLRWKAFRVSWLRLLDEHWIVFPQFVTGGLSSFERLKVRLTPNYVVRHLDTLFTPSKPDEREPWLAAHGLRERGYTVFVPGGRGEAHAAAVDPTSLFVAAADEYAQVTAQTSVVLTGRAQPVRPARASERLLLLPRVRPEDVQHLLAGAARVVCNGGTTMIHALAHGQEIVCAPLATDQARRIRRAARLGVVVAAEPDAGAIARAAAELLTDPARGSTMRHQAAALGLVNGVEEAVAALQRLSRAACATCSRQEA
jgi:spore coat polysaccharide biosynthesis predicted glycosyltransferase SpsG